MQALKVLKPEKNQQDIKSIEGIFSKEMIINLIKNERDKIKKWGEKIIRHDLKYEIKQCVYDFEPFETI